MVLGVYAVKDVKVSFLRPFTHTNDASAHREFVSLVNAKSDGNLIAEHPEDFQLFALGTFDDQTGELVSEVRYICSAMDVRKVVKE